MEDDEVLMAEINAAADKAEAEKPRYADIGLLAGVLSETFEHRSKSDIYDKIKTVWQARGLFYMG